MSNKSKKADKNSQMFIFFSFVSCDMTKFTTVFTKHQPAHHATAISMALCHIVCYLMLDAASTDGVIFIWSIKRNDLNEVVTHILNPSAVMWGSGEDCSWNATG